MRSAARRRLPDRAPARTGSARRAVPPVVLIAALVAACAGGGGAAAPSPVPTSAPSPSLTAQPTTAPTTEPGTPTSAATETAAPGDATSPGEAGWERLADAPTGLTEVAAAPFGGALWTAGGFDADGVAVAQVLVYDPTFDTWEEGPALPEARHHAALVVTDDGLLLLGGYTDATFDAPTDAVLLLDPATGAWTDGPALPAPRAAGAAAWDGARVVYGGGVGPDGVVDDVWALEDGAWQPVGSLGEGREHLAAASDGQGRVWFLGGRRGGLDTNLAAVDLVEGDEVRVLDDLPTARGGVAGAFLAGMGACAVGGEGPDGTFADVECVDAAGAVTVQPPLAVARHGLGVAVVEGSTYAVLGGPEPGLSVSPATEALRAAGG